MKCLAHRAGQTMLLFQYKNQHAKAKEIIKDILPPIVVRTINKARRAKD